MTLQWTTVDIPLGAGLDTKSSEKLLKPPALVDLSDAVFPASGADGYETRKGYDRVRTATTLTDISNLSTRQNELLALADSKLYTISELDNSVDALDRGDLLATAVNTQGLSTKSTNQTLGQVISYQGLEVHCYLDSVLGVIVWTALDAVTGAVISESNSISNSTHAKLTKVGSAILVVYHNSSTTALRAVVIPTYDPSSTSDVELASDANATAVFDVVEVDSSLQKSFVAYSDDSSEITGFLVDEAASVTQSNTILTKLGTVIAVGVSDTGLVVFSGSADELNLSQSVGYTDLSGFTNVATDENFTTEVKVAYAFANSTHYCWAEYAGATNRDDTVELFTSSQSAVDGLFSAGSDITLQHSRLASSAFLLGDDAYVHVSFDTPIQGTYFLTNVDGLVHASCLRGIAQPDTTYHLPRVINGTWAPVFRERLELDLDPDGVVDEAVGYAQYGLKKVTYDTTHKPSAVQYGRAAYLASGLLWSYDGLTLAEQGFLLFPESITTATDDGSGSLANSTSYSYRVYYEWTNASGERQRSTTAAIVTQATSDPVSEDTSTNTLTIPTLYHTHKDSEVSIVVYRTLGDPNINSGAPFFRVSNTNPDTNTGNNRYVANDRSTSTVTFVDGMTDALAGVNELDYLNTGELDNTYGLGSIIGESKNRVWTGGFERGNRVAFSKQNSRVTDQLEFHDKQVLDLPEEGGSVTAIGALNFHTVIFKAGSIYAISGEGPNNLGAGVFNLPQIVSLDVGCIDQRSLVNIPQGIMFKSSKGIWLLGQNLDVQYVGAEVEGYNAQDITAATLVSAENHVVFLTTTGSTLIYNYLVKAWSRFTNHAGNSAVLHNGTYYYARTDGRLYKQSDTNYSDDGVHYSMRFVTAPIGVKGVQGKQRIRHIRLLGEYYSPHTLRVGLRFNHEPGVSSQGTWDPSSGISVSLYGAGAYGSGAYGGSGNPVYQARFNMPRQKCQTVQFTLDTTNTGGAGRAVSIQALQIEVAADNGGLGELSVDRSFTTTE